MNVVIVRPGHIYGPTALKSDSKASSQFAILAKMKKDIVLKSAGNQVRSYCYVYDCASAIITTLINGKSCEAYNISNKASICSIRQLAETFSYFAGTKIIFENPTDREKMAFNPMDNSSLNAKKLEMLGWSGIFSLQEGLRKTLLYM